MHAYHKNMCQDDQRQLVMPARPTAPFIIAQAQQWLAVFDARFHRPPPPTQPHLGGPWGVRWGMTPADMPQLATFIADVLNGIRAPEEVAKDVTAFRKGFNKLRFVR